MNLAGRRPADQQSIRRHNLSLVTRAVSHAPGSRAELAQRTGLTKATVSSLVDSLLAQGIVVEGEPAPAGVGRPARPVALNPSGPVAIGLEVNVDYLAGCRMDLTGAVQARCQLAIDNRPRTAASILGQLARLCAELATPGRPLLGVALAVPGVVGADGRLVRAPNLPRLAGQPLADQLGQRLPLPGVLMDNEANFGALGCLRGGAAGQDFVYVSGESAWAPAWYWAARCFAEHPVSPANSATW